MKKATLLAVVLFAVIGLMANSVVTPSADAAVTDVNIVQASVNSGQLADVNVDLSAADETITISVSNVDGDASGLLVLLSCTPACPGDTGDPASATVTVETDDVTDISLQLLVSCDEGGTVEVSAVQSGAEDESDTIDCVGGGGGQVGGTYQVVLTANPNLLPCGGGTSEIVANAYDINGNLFPDPFFHFSTTAGLIEQTSDNTADLTLGPGQTTAEVTATIADPDPEAEEPIESSVIVSLACNNFVTVVVTANPNVIECGGTSVITATARDANGHVVKGVGFHFTTDAGLLVVLPNNAANEEGIATLTLQPGQGIPGPTPGQGTATVLVSVGTALGTFEAQVTVQQFCPGVVLGQNASAAPGQVLLNSSNNNLVCGEQVFVGMKIRDSKGQVPPDGTAVNLLATSGLLEPTTTTTINGTANVVYTAAAINGDVRITAAAGDSYGFTILKVRCATTSSGTGSAGPAPCTPIGDGVCIAPPNTGGNRITPPNTGEAGLK